jgi:hypothetical protein
LGVVDIDPELLRASAIWAGHTARQGALHAIPEYDADVPAIMDTLVPDGPYAWMIFPQVVDGVPRLPILTSHQEVADGYTMCWTITRMLGIRNISELRGNWYVFAEQLSHNRSPTGQETRGELVTLLTATSVDIPGINGEMCWARKARAELGASRPAQSSATVSESELRRQLCDLHDRYLEALRANDIGGMLAEMNEDVQSPVRDYVDDTGALIGLDGVAAHRAHFGAFFAKYEVLSVDMLDRVSQEWYLFAEIRLTVRERDGAGRTLAFHTAEMFIPAHDGRIIARIGHGTDPA